MILKVYLLIARTSKVKKGEALRENIENVRRNRRLNQLVDTLNLDIEFDQMRFIPDLQELETFFDEVEFRTIRKRAQDILGPVIRALGAQARTAGEEPMTDNGVPSGPTFEPIRTDDSITVTSAADFRAWCEHATHVGYGRDASGNAIEVPERLEGAVTLFPVIDVPVAREGVKVTKTKIRAAEENPVLRGIILTSKNRRCGST